MVKSICVYSWGYLPIGKYHSNESKNGWMNLLISLEPGEKVEGHL